MNTIAHNISAMNAQRQFGINSRAKTKSIEKLSSGYRINRAADDAAGLAISEKMRGQIRGLSQGTRNVQDGISLLQVADGALSEVSEMLHRIKELAVQAANGTNTDTDREFIEDEVFLLLEAIDEISEDTEFNTIPLFKLETSTKTNNMGDIIDIPSSVSNGKVKIMDGPNYIAGHFRFYDELTANDEIKLKVDDTGMWFELNGNMYKPFPTFPDSYNKKNILNQLLLNADGTVKGGYQDLWLSPMTAEIGNSYEVDGDAFLTQLLITEPCTVQDVIDSLNNSTVHVELDTGRYWPGGTWDYKITYIDEKNIGGTSNDNNSDTTNDVDSTEIINGLWIQAGANEGQGMWLTIDNMSTSILGLSDVDVSTVDGATNAIISVREALAKVTKNRSKIGAQQNRLEHTFDREEIAIENLSASESRIRDADMALEMTEYAKINILEQVSQSMMAQANQSEQRVLQLLSM